MYYYNFLSTVLPEFLARNRTIIFPVMVFNKHKNPAKSVKVK
jgi:hypothetical protein